MTLAKVFERLAGPQAPVEFTAYDGTRAGTRGADVRIEVRSPYALSYLVHSPGALGLARAYVSGHLDVHGDMYEALSRMAQMMDDLTPAARLRVLGAVASDPLARAAVTRRLEPPPQEVRTGRLSKVPWLRHSKW